jgi:dethiobiotin synthetase
VFAVASQEMRSIHILGTDTDVGKSWVTRLVLDWCQQKGIKGLPIKPLHSGWPQGEALGPDLIIHPEAEGRGDELCAYRMEAPMSPFTAAKVEGKTILLDELNKSWKSWQNLEADLLVVEGIGGVCCPLSKNLTYVDWIQNTPSVCLLVSTVGLGSLNHSILSLRALEQAHCEVMAVLPNQEMLFEEDDPIVSSYRLEMAEMTPIPILPMLIRDDLEQNREVISQCMDAFWASGR